MEPAEQEKGGAPRIRALTFSGGAFDTVMQLGVAHALLVSDGVPPDHVAGISAGAINAAALAEILQAGGGFEDEDQRRAACVRRLREFIDAYVEIPTETVDSTFPDAFEVNAQKALEPLELPVHFQEERASRKDANRSKAGLIRLINQFLRIRLTTGAATKMLRRGLAIAQSSELKRPKAVRNTRVWNYVGIWLAGLAHSYAVSQIAISLIYAALIGRSKHRQKTAGQIILAVRWLSTAGNAAKSSAAFLLFLAVWLLPVTLVIRLPHPPWLIRIISSGIDAATRWIAYPLRGLFALLSNLDWLLQLAFGGTWRLLHLTSGRTSEILGMFLATNTAHAVWTTVSAHRAQIALALLALLVALLLDLFFNVRARWVLLGYAVLLCTTPFALLVGVVLAIVIVLGWLLHQYLPHLPVTTRILEYYEVGDGILSSDILLQQLVNRFDAEYHGKHVVAEMIDAALQRADAVSTSARGHVRRSLDDYLLREPPIHVAPVAANLSTGKLEILRASTAIVRALMAATATSPLFPAAEIEEPPVRKRWLNRAFRDHRRHKSRLSSNWYIDGLNISNEPIEPLLDYLRDEYAALLEKEKKGNLEEPDRNRLAELRKAETVDLYPVSDLPVDHPEIESQSSFSTLVEVTLRAVELKQFRDAAMERRLTRLFTKALPSGKAFVEEDQVYVHAGIFPIELDRPAHVNRRVARGASVDELRTILRATVADGCRASLETMVPRMILDEAELTAWAELNLDPSIVDSMRADQTLLETLLDAGRTAKPQGNRVAIEGFHAGHYVCTTIVSRDEFDRLIEIVTPRCRAVMSKHGGTPLPGSDPASGPGVSEVCRQCRLFRSDAAATAILPSKAAKESTESERPPFNDQIRLRGKANRLHWPQWPRGSASVVAPPPPPPPPPVDTAYEWPVGWPAVGASTQCDPVTRPTISLLFGGGVFRGVYHMGVMNALNEAGVRPDIVAGSSVGSIIAAMIASVFKEEDKPNENVRGRRIRRLAATFLAIDRFVLTDRLADFVRRFTLRAAEARFSPRDLDLVLRRFDIDFPGRFSKRTRNVAAGLERLLYLSPFELYTIVRAARLQDFSTLLTEILGDLQEVLDRGAVGREILGSEPLSLLIERLVEDPLQGVIDTKGEMRFDSFLEGERKIYFLATTTNLMRGALEILGAPYNKIPYVSLRQGLLASSAFPAIFRPRHGWEIFLGNLQRDDLYIDGGVIDNLPVDAVARFLNQAAKRGKIVARPAAAPHLLFTASLEVTRDILPMDPRAIRATKRNFLEVRKRAKTFNLNRKIDAYRAAQTRLNRLWDKHHKNDDDLLRLSVLAVKPNWLCNTFGFHPMLGFRRRKQMQSIAHGCATTLAELHANNEKYPGWFAAWGIGDLRFDPNTSVRQKIPGATHDQRVLVPRMDRNSKNGQCWFRKDGVLCPFSRQWRLENGVPEERKPQVRPEELRDLHEIYLRCGDPSTHLPTATG